MPAVPGLGPNLTVSPHSRELLSPRTLPSPRPLPSERSHRSTPYLRLPPLQEVAETGEGGGDVAWESGGWDQVTTPQLGVRRLPPYEAYTLLRQYDSLVPTGTPHPRTPGNLPQIKISIRTTMARNTARSRFTTLSLEKIEQQGKLLFTEGISASSRRPEPSFHMQRRDIIDANMPDTVKLARERSKITFGLRNSSGPSPRSFHDLFPTPRPVKTFGLEATDGLTAISRAASNKGRRRSREDGGTPGTPQETMFDIIRRENRSKVGLAGWTATPRPHLVPDNTPRTGLADVKREPSTIQIPKLDTPVSPHPAPLATLHERPKEAPEDRKEELTCRSSLSIVSLGEALSPIDQERQKVPIRALHASFDFRPAKEKVKDKDREKDVFSRGQRFEPSITNFEVPLNSLLDQRTVSYSKRPLQLRDDISLRNRKGGHPRNRLRTKWDSQLTVTDSGSHEMETPDIKDGLSDSMNSGWDKDLTVRAMRQCARDGSATSSSLNLLVNPPPSIAATSLGEDEIRTLGGVSSHPQMCTVPEEQSLPNTSRLGNTVHTAMVLSDSEQVSNPSHLGVPPADVNSEGRPPFPGSVGPEVSGSESARTIGIQTSPPYHRKNVSARSISSERKIKVKTLELFPSNGAANGLKTPSVGTSSDPEDKEPSSGNKSSEGEGSPERKPSAGSLSIHSKTFKFISPLETQENAKRQ